MDKKLFLCIIPMVLVIAGCATSDKQKMQGSGTNEATINEQQEAVVETATLPETSMAPVEQKATPEKPSKKDTQNALYDHIAYRSGRNTI